MATKKKEEVIVPPAPEANVIKSDTLDPDKLPEAQPHPNDKVEKWEEEGMVKIDLKKPFTLNGKLYGPGLTVVPKDAWHIWKSCT